MATPQSGTVPGAFLTPGIDVSTPMPPPPPAPILRAPEQAAAPVVDLAPVASADPVVSAAPAPAIHVESVESVTAGEVRPPTGPADTPLGDPAPRRRGVLIALGAFALVGLVGAVSFVVFGGGSEEQRVTTEAPIAEEPSTPVEDVAPAADPVVDDVVEAENDAVGVEQEPAPIEDADADADVDVDASAVTEEPVASVAESADEPAADPVDEADVPAPADPGVAESAATVRNGQIFLEGAVPTQEAGEELASLAAEILGADNVFNNYVVDPNAGDPSLGNVTVEDTINFGTDSAVLLDPDNPLLGQGVALMTIRPAMTITIVGHTDSRGSQEGNEALSLERAEAIKAFFVDSGIEPDRLTTEGAGASEPIASNDTAAGRSDNRRIQFFLQNIL